MSEYEQRILFSDNLKRIIAEKNKTQVEIADAIGVSPQTFNTWVIGKAIPRMNKLQALADYFKVPKSVLIDKQEPNRETTLQEIYDRSRILFDAAEDASVEDINKAAEYLEFLKTQK